MNCILLWVIFFGLYAINPLKASPFICSDICNFNDNNSLSIQDTLVTTIGDSPDNSYWQFNLTNTPGFIDTNTLIFQFEVFVNQYFKEQILCNPATINNTLGRYLDKLGKTDVLKLILINKDYIPLNIQSAYRSYTTTEQEVCFYFHPGYPVQYIVEVIEKSSEVVDFYFFYIEKSNGIENLRDVRERIEPLLRDNIPFLAYFHGPENDAIIVSHENDSYEVDEFFNILFTSRTQPPMVPNDELLNVHNAISQFVSSGHHRINLKMYLYFNEASYSFLLEPFITPLLDTRIPKLNLFNWQTSIMTDFSIQSQNDNYNYINLVKP